jgi:hypothetical protein
MENKVDFFGGGGCVVIKIEEVEIYIWLFCEKATILSF